MILSWNLLSGFLPTTVVGLYSDLITVSGFSKGLWGLTSLH